jgi:hypothetical protein
MTEEEEEEKSPNSPSAMIFQSILDQYEPASNIQEADVLLTTDDVTNNLRTLYPYVMPDDVYRFLTNSGFKYGSPGDLKFFWLFRKKLLS